MRLYKSVQEVHDPVALEMRYLVVQQLIKVHGGASENTLRYLLVASLVKDIACQGWSIVRGASFTLTDVDG